MSRKCLKICQKFSGTICEERTSSQCKGDYKRNCDGSGWVGVNIMKNDE